LTRATGSRTSYLWLEAEDLWGHQRDDVCEKGCSGGNMSSLGGLVGDNKVTVKTVPGEYWIWARTRDTNIITNIIIDGSPYQLFNKSYPGLVGWYT